MKFSTSLTGALALSGTTLAAALPKRTTYSGVVTDGDVLNYALTLEHLEDKFYRDGLMNFTQAQFAAAGFDATFYRNLKEISYDETTHVSFLTGALQGEFRVRASSCSLLLILDIAAGVAPVVECSYAFGVTSVAAFVATASVLEGVGVSACTYLEFF
jgi:hypothetical protein